MKNVIFILILLISSCSTKMDIEKFANNQPKLILEEYFSGNTKAWGYFHDRFGNLQRSFTVKINGKWDGKFLILDEDFLYDDGEKQKRVWKIEKISNGKYSGSADDVVGYANGISSGNALNWAYELLLEVKGKKIKVKFDDCMFLHDRGVLINRAEISKFGINLGVVTITFIRI